MKVVEQTKEIGAIRAVYTATIETAPNEMEELRKALGTVEHFKHTARKATGAKHQNADWTMYRFDLNKHDGKVIVTIDQGACG